MPKTQQHPRENNKERLRALLKAKAQKTFSISRPSRNQMRSWSSRKSGKFETLTIWWACELISGISKTDLTDAFQKVTLRHANLRSRFQLGEDGLEQWVAGYSPFQMEELHGSTLDTDDPALLEFVERPFDLDSGQLIRVGLLYAENRVSLIVAIDHIVGDLWSLLIILEEVGEILSARRENRKLALPAPVQHSIYVDAIETYLASDAGQIALIDWADQLSGTLPRTRLSPDHRKSDRSVISQASVVPFSLSPELTQDLRRVAKQQDVSLYTLLLASFQTAMFRYTGEEDTLIGTVATGRSHSNFSRIVGDLVNPQPIRQKVDGNSQFPDLLRRTKKNVLRAFSTQDIPYSEILARLDGTSSGVFASVFETLFIFQKPHRGEKLLAFPDIPTKSKKAQWAGGFIRPLALSQYGQEDDENRLTCEIIELSDWIGGSFRYDAALFDCESVAAFAENFETLLESIVSSPNARIEDLNYCSVSQLKIIEDFNATYRPDLLDVTLTQAMQERARCTPDAVAMIWEDQTRNYGDFHARVSEIGAALKICGVGPGDIVALCMDRSFDLVESIWGIWAAGAAYLPLDVGAPISYLETIVSDAKPKLILTQSRGDSAFVELQLPDVEILPLKEVLAAKTGSVNFTWSERGPETVSYVIYTSGSTGRPKGVVCCDAGLNNRIAWMQAHYQLNASERVLHKTPYTFDVSVWEFTWPFVAGAALVICPPDMHRDATALARLMVHTKVNIVHFVPSMLEAFLEAADMSKLNELRLVLCSGEVLRTSTAQGVVHALPNVHLGNLYGPTEASIDVTYWDYSGDDLTHLSCPIGRPIANMRVHVLDSAGNRVGIGSLGEICLEGPGLAQGYLNRPDLTAQNFVSCPWSSESRIYRTGDFGRWKHDGLLEYLGRADAQVKLRGMRIELGEIEAATLSFAGVESAVAMVKRGQANNDLLCVTYLSSEPIDEDELRDCLVAQLPTQMIPHSFIRLEEWPLTVSGKLDRKKLAQSSPTNLRGSYDPPRTEMEQRVAEFFEKILGHKRLSRDARFFELGGDSLLAIRLAALVRSELSIELPLATYFAATSVMELAERIERALNESLQSSIPPMVVSERDGPRSLSFAQERLWVHIQEFDLAGAALNVGGVVRLRGTLDILAMERSLLELITRHHSLRTRFDIVDGSPIQIVDEVSEFRIDLEDLNGDQKSDLEMVARRRAQEIVRQPLDLEEGPLFRHKLLRLSDRDHFLVVVLHHIISDAWSMSVMAQEIGKLYSAFAKGQSSPLAPLPVQYADYSEWQRRWLTGDVLNEQLTYWTRKLAGAPKRLKWPIDHTRPAVQSFRGSSVTLQLTNAMTKELRAIALKSDSTLFMVLLAALQVLIGRWCRQEDFVIGIPVAGRTHREIEGLIGFFVNILALRADLKQDPSFIDLVGRVQKTTLEAYDHQDLPFQNLVEAVQPNYDASTSPIFQVFVNGLFLEHEERSMLDLEWETLEFDDDASNFDMTVYITAEQDGAATLRFTFSNALFSHQTIDALGHQLRNLLGNIIGNPLVRISLLDN